MSEKDPRNEPFIAPSADEPATNRKKVLAGKGLMKVLLCLALFLFLIWGFIGFRAIYHSFTDAKCIQTDSCV